MDAELIAARFRGDFGRFALDAAFSAPPRGVTALFGPSGCGKTTVLRCLAGLARAREGFCRVGGQVWQDARTFRPPHERRVGYVFQDARLFPHLSVARNLAFAAPKRADVDEVVEFLALGPLLTRSPARLSGGERQRVAIGRALLSAPELLLLDEPLSALDDAAKAEILPFLERLRERLKLPAIYVTHDRSEVERLADHLVLMREGRVVAEGPLEEVQSDLDLPLAGARGAAVSLDGVIVVADPGDGLVEIEVLGAHFLAAGAGGVGERRRLRIAAGDVSLALAPPGRSSILNVAPARVRALRPLPPGEVVVALGLGEDGAGAQVLARVTRRSLERLALAEGMLVYAQIKSVALARGD